MDGETFYQQPDGAVILGARSILSMVGLTTALCGYWYMEYKFDNEGSAALLEAKNKDDDDYVEMEETNKTTAEEEPESVLVSQKFHPNGVRELVRVTTEDSKSQPSTSSYKNMADHDEDVAVDPETVYPTDEGRNINGQQQQPPQPQLSSEVQQRLHDAMPLPRVMLVGFGIWAISFLFDPSIGGGRLYFNFWNMTSFVLAACIGPIIAVPIRLNTLSRDVDRKKKSITSLVVVSLLLCVTATADFIVDAPWFFNVFGILFMLLSYHILRRSRRMGLTWDLEAKPSDDVTVFNLGTMLLMFGLVLFWIGSNGVLLADIQQSYLPVYISARSWCVFVAGMILIVPSMMALDLAFDERSSVVTYYKYFPCLDGSTLSRYAKEIKLLDISPLTRLMETPVFYFCGWTLMGLCSFLPFGLTGVTVQKCCVMAVCLCIGPFYAFVVLPSMWQADASSFQRYLYVYYVLMILLATGIGVGGEIELVLSIAGVLLTIVGQRQSMHERKRGQTWLDNQSTNPNPQVYGLGLPIFVLGWIFLCLAMSIPM